MPDIEQSKDVSDVQILGAAAGVGQENDWSSKCISEARISTPLVTEDASKILTVLLRGSLSERALTSTELTTLANHLIDVMIPSQPPPKAGAEKPE